MQHKIYCLCYEDNILVSKRFDYSVKTKKEAHQYFEKMKNHFEETKKVIFRKTSDLIWPYLFLENFTTEVNKEFLRITEWKYTVRLMILEVI